MNHNQKWPQIFTISRAHYETILFSSSKDKYQKSAWPVMGKIPVVLVFWFCLFVLFLFVFFPFLMHGELLKGFRWACLVKAPWYRLVVALLCISSSSGFMKCTFHALEYIQNLYNTNLFQNTCVISKYQVVHSNESAFLFSSYGIFDAVSNPQVSH